MRQVLLFPPAFAVLVLTMLCLAPLSAFAADPFAALTERAASVMTVRSDFVQETVIPLFSRPVRSQGRFVFRRPDCLRWEYTSPMREGFALKGDAIIRWEEGDDTNAPITAGPDPLAGVIARQLMAWITVDRVVITREYGIETLGEVPLVLRMTPLRDDVRSVVAGIVITFSADGPASLVEIQEAAGGRTTITFSGTVVNGPVDDGEFDRR